MFPDRSSNLQMTKPFLRTGELLHGLLEVLDGANHLDDWVPRSWRGLIKTIGDGCEGSQPVGANLGSTSSVHSTASSDISRNRGKTDYIGGLSANMGAGGLTSTLNSQP